MLICKTRTGISNNNKPIMVDHLIGPGQKLIAKICCAGKKFRTQQLICLLMVKLAIYC